MEQDEAVRSLDSIAQYHARLALSAGTPDEQAAYVQRLRKAMMNDAVVKGMAPQTATEIANTLIEIIQEYMAAAA